ncbi:MAG: arginase family protein [Rhodobacteraceae bacterium]|nr:arginase family protein [Paracoccaceae bacterium]
MRHPETCCLLGAPVGAGAGVAGCELGPAAYRAAGLAEALGAAGWSVADLGDAHPQPAPVAPHPNRALRHLPETVGMIRGLGAAALEAGRRCDLPVFLGGDHSISAATIPAMALRAREAGRPFFLLWLDAHPDLHDLDTTASGNLHGTPAAYVLGLDGFAAFPALPAGVAADNVCMMGLRSVDGAEAPRLAALGIAAHPMAELAKCGVDAPLARFLDRVAHAGGDLHVSFDVDFLDPAVAPAVGTAVPDGASAAEAHRIAAALSDSGLVTSLDLVELNPRLDPEGSSVALIRDLACAMLPPRAALRRTGT